MSIDILAQNQAPEQDSSVCPIHWNEWTNGSAISGEITKLNLKSVYCKGEIATFLGWKKYTHSEGWIAGGQFKPDSPIQLPKADKPAKYLTSKAGYDAILLKVLDPDYWAKVEADPAVPIIITEGAKKTAACLTQGDAAIGLCGVTMAFKAGGKELVPSLQSFVVSGRTFIIVFDSDKATKDAVLWAENNLAQHLAAQGCHVKITQWDPSLGKGIDDVIVNHGSETYRQIVDQAQLWEPLSPIDESDKVIDISTAKGGRKRDPDADLPMDPASPAAFLKAAQEQLFSATKWICWENTLHRWTGSYYEPVNDESLKPDVWKFCAGYRVVRTNKQDGSYAVFPFSRSCWISEILEWQKCHCTVTEINPPGINCLNGFLELHWQGSQLSAHLKAHDPARYILNAPSFVYDPEADPCHYERLMECLDPDARTIWERTIAAALDLGTVRKYQGRGVKALLLKGHGANGKDTLRALVQILFGSESVTNTSTTDWAAYDAGSASKVANLLGKRVSWASETADIGRIDKLQGLKAAITGDPYRHEPKYINGKSVISQAVFLFSINEIPNISTSLKAIESRWGIVPFNKTYSNNPKAGELPSDPRFKEDPAWVRENILPAFLNQMIAQLQAVVTHGIDHSPTQGLLDEYARESSHILQFAQDVGLDYEPGSHVEVGVIWEQLKDWYINNGYLSVEVSPKGKEKLLWQDPPGRSDRLVKVPRLIVSRFLELFPKAKRGTNRDSQGRTTTYLMGLKLSAEQFAPILGSVGSVPLKPSPSKDPSSEPKNILGSVALILGSEPDGSLQPLNPNETQSEPKIVLGSELEPAPSKDSEPTEPTEPKILEKTSAEVSAGIVEDPFLTCGYWQGLKAAATDLGIPDQRFLQILHEVTGIPLEQIRGSKIRVSELEDIFTALERAADPNWQDPDQPLPFF